MILNFSFQFIINRHGIWFSFSLAKTYRVLCSASVEVLWQKLINLGDVSWHPFFMSTNVPKGLIPKPGLIYQAVTRWIPIPIQIFVEGVRPGELLSFRILAVGSEHRIIYQIESTLCGSYISYSMTLKGWSSPFIWWLIKPYAAKVAQQLAQAAQGSIQRPAH